MNDTFSKEYKIYELIVVILVSFIALGAVVKIGMLIYDSAEEKNACEAAFYACESMVDDYQRDLCRSTLIKRCSK